MNKGDLMNCRFPRAEAFYRLFCFPWAGGGSNFYANWSKSITDNVEVFGITLPGRETRFKDPCCGDVVKITEEISKRIHDDYSEKPFIFWGHSMGALLCFEVARLLRERYGLEPRRLYLSGISAPHSEMRKKRKTIISSMTDEEFKEYLKRLGGTPKEIIENDEMMAMFLPSLRADYSLVNTYSYELKDGPPPLTCPISFFDGEDDLEHDIDGWRQVTSGTLSVTKLPGGHFYIKDPQNASKIQTIISRDFSGLDEIV